MVVHLFLNNNKALDFLPINSIKNGGITRGATENALLKRGFAQLNNFRPAFIEPIGVQSQTASYRWMYRLMTPFFPLINRFSASALTSVQLGNAMLNAVRFNENRPVLEAAEIRALGERRA